ncbi:MAG: hypothetical protein WEA82_03390 [Idiomarina sp.]
MKSFKYFAPHKTALTVAILFAIASLIFLISTAAMFSFIPGIGLNGENVAFPLGIMMLTMPIVYFVMGYVFTALFAWLYNQVAKFTGGVTFELSE